MSLLVADGFDLYATVNDVIRTGVWYGDTTGLTVNPTSGRFNGGALGGTVDDNGWTALMRTTDFWSQTGNTSAPGDTLIISWYYKVDNGSMSDDSILQCFSSTSDQCGLRHTAAGAVYARNNSDNTVGSASATGLIVPNEWAYIEFKVLIGAGTSGAITVRVNEVEALATISSIDTHSGDYSGVRFTGDNSQWLIDDVVIMNDRGSRLNDFIGETRIATLLPAGDTAQNDWAQSSSGDTFTLVDKPLGTSPDDAEYIEAKVSNDETRVSFEAPPNNLEEVHAITSVYQCRKTDILEAQVEAYIRSNAVDDVTHKGVVIDAYCTNRFVHELDEGSGSPTEQWDEASLTAIEMGVRIV